MENFSVIRSFLHCREVFFETNGVPRVVEVVEKLSEESKSAGRAVREKGDPTKVGSVSAPMSGDVIDIKIKAGKIEDHRLCMDLIIE